jgi:hypothetical protein
VVRGVPHDDPHEFVDLLARLGKPRQNYAARSSTMSEDDPHAVLNLVRYKPPADRTNSSVHYVDGALDPHSARAWSDPRPSYFAMLMVDPGWRRPSGEQSGHSLFVRWRDLFHRLARRDGLTFERHFSRLTGTSLRFGTDNVDEPVSDLPLCYELADMADDFDRGVRLKQRMQSKLWEIRDSIPNFEEYRLAVEYLVANANQDAHQIVFPLEAGDMIILDNDRVAHGRLPFVGAETINGKLALNPREIWSASLD